MRRGSGGQRTGVFPDEIAARKKVVHDQPVHPEPGGYRLPVRAGLAILGGGHCARFQLAVRARHVQGGAYGHGDEHVRERVLPHCYEHHALLGRGVGAERPQSALCLLGPLGERAALAPRHNRHNTHHHLLRAEGRVRRKPMLDEFPWWQPLARLVPPAESFDRLRFPYADRVRMLRASAALPEPSQHE